MKTMISAYFLIGAAVQLICEAKDLFTSDKPKKITEKELFINLVVWPIKYPFGKTKK